MNEFFQWLFQHVSRVACSRGRGLAGWTVGFVFVSDGAGTCMSVHDGLNTSTMETDMEEDEAQIEKCIPIRDR